MESSEFHIKPERVPGDPDSLQLETRLAVPGEDTGHFIEEGVPTIRHGGSSFDVYHGLAEASLGVQGVSGLEEEKAASLFLIEQLMNAGLWRGEYRDEVLNRLAAYDPYRAESILKELESMARKGIRTY